jgi:hypothetical protein
VKVLPAGPGLHPADFKQNVALKLTRTIVDVGENERLAVEGVTNLGAGRRKGSVTFSSIAVPSSDKGRVS